MKKRYLALIVLICSCTTQKNLNKATFQSGNLVPDGKLFNAVFQQQAAEYRALCFQAYNIATLRLNEILKDTSSTMPNAIVTDIDETIRSEEHTSELQSRENLVCRLLLEKKKKKN